MNSNRRSADDLAYAAALVALGVVLTLWLNVGGVSAHEPTPTPVPTLAPDAYPDGADQPPVEQCTEDMPCWDCATMGNGICGEATPAPTREATSSNTYAPVLPDTAAPAPASEKHWLPFGLSILAILALGVYRAVRYPDGGSR